MWSRIARRTFVLMKQRHATRCNQSGNSGERRVLITHCHPIPTKDMDFEGAEVRLPGGAAAESSAGSSVSDRVRRALAKHHEDKARQIPAAMRQQQDSPVRATFTPGTAEPARRSRAVIAELEPSPAYEGLLGFHEPLWGRGVKPHVLDQLTTDEDCPGGSSESASAETCHICLGGSEAEGTPATAEMGGRLRLPCSHAFCQRCIRRWLAGRDTCPVCRWSFPESDTHTVLM